MIEDILKKVESPFTDETIQKLMETFISCGCDESLTYKKINNSEENIERDEDTRKLIEKIYSIGTSDLHKDKNKPGIYYGGNQYWTKVSSQHEPFDPHEDSSISKRDGLLYRFYLNLKGKEKSDFVLEYLERCQKEELPFCFKFSKTALRPDQIIILSRIQDFEKNFDILQELTKGKKLGEIPMFIGKHDSGIGIAEEYYYRYMSPTQIRIELIKPAIIKYLCDHKEELYSKLTDYERGTIDYYLEERFEKKYTRYKNFLEEFGEEKYKKNIDRKRLFFERMRTIDRLKEHIELPGSRYLLRKFLKVK